LVRGYVLHIDFCQKVKIQTIVSITDDHNFAKK